MRATNGADGSGRIALICETADQRTTRYTFDELKQWSDCFADALQRDGVQRVDRVGIFLSQSVETALAHLAVYKCGAIAVPLFALFGPDALQYRLADSGAVALVTDRAGLRKIAPLVATLPELRTLYDVDARSQTEVGRPAGEASAAAAAHSASALTRAFWPALRASSAAPFEPVATHADDPAVIIYTSGTTGKPKGALHARRVLLGHLPGVEMPQAFFPERATLIWTPADWAWIGGLFDVLLPA